MPDIKKKKEEKKIIAYGKENISEKSIIYLPTLRNVFRAGVTFLVSFLDFVWLAISGGPLIDLGKQFHRLL